MLLKSTALVPTESLRVLHIQLDINVLDFYVPAAPQKKETPITFYTNLERFSTFTQALGIQQLRLHSVCL